MPEERNCFRIVERHAATRPDAPALTGMGWSWTYGELVDQAGRIAGALEGFCRRRGDRIAIVADNHPLTCLIYLAAIRSGRIVSLVNSFFKTTELAMVFGKLQPQLVICDPSHRVTVTAALEQAGQMPALATLEKEAGSSLPCVEDWISAEPFGGDYVAADACMEISWTSGTTSAPKGVMLTHDTALFRAECEIRLFDLSEADCAAVITPLFHQSGIRNSVLLMWVCGGHAVILPRFDVATFWADMVRYRVTYLCMVETILLMLERNPPCEEERSNCLRTILAAGEPGVIKRCEERFGFRVIQVWGMTETGVSTGVRLSCPIDEVQRLREWGRGANLAGWPVSEDTVIRLVADGKIVGGEGGSGEIQISSRLLFAGYFGEPDVTAAAYDGGWFKTGDLAIYGPGGALYFQDRLKDVIRRGGENIASKQVEEVLLAHPRVKRAAVIPVPDPLFMQEVKAVVVTEGDLPAEELWAWCDDRLARYKVPRYIEFRDSLPVNGSGRVQKQLLIAAQETAAFAFFDRRAAKAVA